MSKKEANSTKSILDFLPPLPSFIKQMFTRPAEKTVKPLYPGPNQVLGKSAVEEPAPTGTHYALYVPHKRLTAGQEAGIFKEQTQITTVQPGPRANQRTRNVASSSMGMPREKTLVRALGRNKSYNSNIRAGLNTSPRHMTAPARYDRNSPEKLALLRKQIESLPEEAFQNSSRVMVQSGRGRPRTFS